MVIRRYWKLSGSVLIAGLLCYGCGKVAADDGGDVPGGCVEDGRIEIRLAPGVTKVAGDSFEAGDRIGVFMAYDSETYLDNQEFAAVDAGNGLLEWKADVKFLWKDEVNVADFRCYYPYSQEATGGRMLQCRVMTDQSTHMAFSDSDILWGESLQVEPTSDCVVLMTSHRAGQVVVEVVPGNGYDQTTLAAAIENLVLKGAVCGARLNLETGELVACGDVQDLIPYAEGLVFRVLLPPQKIAELEVKVNVAGMERSLKTSAEIVSGHRQHCTITVDKVAEGVNVGIDGWEDDGEDFGGILN